MIDVATNELAGRFGPGEYTAVVTFRDVTTSQSWTRDVVLTIDQPVSVVALDPDPQEFTGLWSGPFDTPIPQRFLCFSK